MEIETQDNRTPAARRWDSWLVASMAVILVLAVLAVVAFIVYLSLHGIPVPDPKVAD